MRGKISTGIWFIFFGLIALLHNFDIIHFNFWALIPYWPLMIVAIGANLIFQNRTYSIAIISIINVAICLFLTYVGMTSSNSFNFPNTININSNPEDTVGTSNFISTPYQEEIESTHLILNIGAIALTLDSTSSTELFEASTTKGNAGLKLERSGDDINPELEVTNVIKKEGQNNRASFSLNSNPIWDIEVNMGASSFTADLQNHKFSNLEINAGAASLYLKFGMPTLEVSNVEINTAASSVKINIPYDAACRVHMSTFLSSKKLEGFEKIGDYYQTEDFDIAEKKYILNIDGAANSLQINRY